MTTVRRRPDVLLDWHASPPQTNEVRSSAVLIARSRAVLDLAQRARPPVDRDDTATLLKTRPQVSQPDSLPLVCHTVACRWKPMAQDPVQP